MAVTINSRRRKFASAVCTALLERPVASASMRKLAGTGFHFARGLAVEIKINEIRGRLSIVPDDIAHQNVEHIVVDRNCFAETRHFLNVGS